MSFFNKYPYSDIHELNLDWILAKIKELNIAFEEFKVVNNITFSGQWDITKQYPAWTIVSDNNIGYVSQQPVPAGVVLTNTDYWVEVIDYTAQIAGLQQRVVDLENSKVLYYETVADMIADTDITEDNIMITSGYYTALDGGASVYKAKAAAPGTYYETLSNGIYAELITDKTINVKQLGAVGDGTTDDSGKINYAFNNYDEIIMNPETYYCQNKIAMNKNNVTIHGNNAKILFDGNVNIVYDEETPPQYYMWLIFLNTIKDITINDLNVVFASGTTIFDAVSASGSESAIFTMHACENVLFNNCHVKIENVVNNVSNAITCLWIRRHDGSYTFNNCSFISENMKNDTTGTKRMGGVVWVLGHQKKCVFNDCIMEGDCIDEVFTTWQGNTDSPVILNNCDIKTALTFNDSGIAVCAFDNAYAIANNCRISNIQRAFNVIRGGNLLIDGCDLKLNVMGSSPSQCITARSDRVIIKNSKITVYYDLYSLYNSVFDINNGDLVIDSCFFVITSNSLSTVFWYVINSGNNSGKLYFNNNQVYSDESVGLYIMTSSGTAASIKMTNNSYLNNIKSLGEYGVSVTNALSQNRFVDQNVPAPTGNAQKLY